MATYKLSLLALAALGAALLPSGRCCVAKHFEDGELLAAVATGGSGQRTWDHYRGGADWPGVCTAGRSQSPVGIVTANISSELPPDARASLDFGTVSGLRIFNTGYAIQVEWDCWEGGNASVPVLDGDWGSLFSTDAQTALAGDGASAQLVQLPLKPLQMHWHSNCEHVVDGDTCPLELHIVTAVDNTTGQPVPDRCNQDPCFAVFGVQLKLNVDPYAPGDPFMDMVLSNVPDAVGAEAATHLPDATLDLSSLFPRDLSYVTYNGSLTTPPCTEGLAWHVFLASIPSLSAQQIETFQALLATTIETRPATCAAGGTPGEHGAGPDADMTCSLPAGSRTNNRVLQPLGDRQVLVSMAE